MVPQAKLEKTTEGKGFLEILFHLKEAPMSFTELTKKLTYSRATISARLQEALKLKLVEPKWILKGRMRVRWQYSLSEEGAKMLNNLDGKGYLKATETIRQVQNRAMEVAMDRRITSS